jgi:transcriptional regulator with XRE-family HTH domain
MLGDQLIHLGQRLRLRRLEANLSQDEVARRSGMSLSGYQKLERTGNVTLRLFGAVLVALGRESELDRLLEERREYASLEEFMGGRSVRTRRPRVRASRTKSTP